MKDAIIKKYSYRFGTNERELFAKQYAISEGETLEEGFYRATEPFTDESKRLQIFKKIMEKRFCPGGRILAGAGTEHRNTTNCFVLGPDSKKFDSLDDVLDLVLKVAATTKVGGGIGINFDPFASVKNAQPIDIEIYHTLDPSHPDFEDFTAWQYTDTTDYGQPKRRYKAPGLLKVDYSERESLGAPIIVVGDSIASIFSAPFEAVRLGAKKVVLDWSNLRPEGSQIRGSGGTSSGAASFAIEVEHIIRWLRLGGHTAGPVNALRLVFQPILRSVRQGGVRRGAGMATLSMSHPDRELFLTAKDHAVEEELGKISTFNISFLVTDQDMQDPFIERIAEHAWQTGDPGLLFIDSLNRYNPFLEVLGPILSTNPCLTGDTMILTAEGPRSFKDLADDGRDVLVWCVDKESNEPKLSKMVRPHMTRQNAEVLKITFDSGLVVKATPDHSFFTTHLNKVAAKDLRPGQSVSAFAMRPAEPVLNHKVVSVEPAGYEDVYNGMVEQYHTYIVVDPQPVGKSFVSGVLSANCGEQGLYPGESCDLGAINLSRYVDKSYFDRKLFAEDVLLYTDFLDANIDYSRMPTEQATIMSQRNRRVGLGLMGLHHALIKLGYAYASEKGRREAASLMELMSEKALEWSESAYDGHTDMAIDLRRRNVALLTAAPTGTTSMIMNVSSGIEPIFSVTYRRKIGSTDKTFMDPLLMEMLREHDPSPAVATIEDGKVEWDEDAVVAAVKANRGSVQGLEFVPRYIQELFLTAQEIHWRDHVLMQGAMQGAMDTHGVGNAISKTINMPNNATVEDVLGAYRFAHEVGCKGITVYRDGSRSNQVLNLDTEVSLECPSGVCEL